MSRRSARGQQEDASAEANGKRSDHKVASARHQMALVAQALGHSDAAQGWHIEAPKTAARLKDYGLCARTAHQLGKLCQHQGRWDEAVAWSVLSLATMRVAPGRAERRGFQNRNALTGPVEFVAVQSIWRSTTGEHLPARLERALKVWLDISDHRQAAAGPARDLQVVPAFSGYEPVSQERSRG